jgi:hypothetical protein
MTDEVLNTETQALLDSDTVQKGPEGYARHVREFTSDDGKVKFHASAQGGQIWDLVINKFSVMFALAHAHSVSIDKRPTVEFRNEFEEGETTEPGGSWLSFARNKVPDGKGGFIKRPVHGHFSAPWFRFAIDKVQSTGNSLRLLGKSIDKFFLENESYDVVRTMTARSADGDNRPAQVIENVITKHGTNEEASPEIIEHMYLNSGKGAYILGANGEKIRPEDLPHAEEKNDNKIDSRINPPQISKPGECVFFPNGDTGPVIVMHAAYKVGENLPIQVTEFCVYRINYDDPWTAIEPSVPPTKLTDGESITMTVSVETYETIDEYYAIHPKQVAA